MSGFKRAKKDDQHDDDHVKLLCTEPGCGRLWLVHAGKPQCSFHAWGRVGESYVQLASASLQPKTDGKTWARRILALHESGAEVRPISLKMARDALRVHRELA